MLDGAQTVDGETGNLVSNQAEPACCQVVIQHTTVRALQNTVLYTE
jgi:hypothetical protein